MSPNLFWVEQHLSTTKRPDMKHRAGMGIDGDMGPMVHSRITTVACEQDHYSSRTHHRQDIKSGKTGRRLYRLIEIQNSNKNPEFQ